MGYNLKLTPREIPGQFPFVDTGKLRFLTGGVTIDAAHAVAAFSIGADQGQIAPLGGRLRVLPGAVLCEDVDSGLWQVYTPAAVEVKSKMECGEGTAKLTFTSKLVGAAGNSIQISIIKPEAASQDLAVNVLGNNIEISLKTDADSKAVSTAAEVKAKIEGVAGAHALVEVAGGAGVVEEFEGWLPLVGGADAVSANLSTNYAVLLFDDSAFVQDENGAAANCVTTGLDAGRVISARLPLTPDVLVLTAFAGRLQFR